MATVSLTNTKHFTCSDEMTILEAANAQNIILEHSCRTGRCGVCKAKIISGTTQAIKPEDSLSADELREGYILTCARSALTDTILDTEDLGELASIKKQTLPARIDSIKHLADNVLSIQLRLPPKAEFTFLPGQYIDIIGKTGIRRSYSIANSNAALGKIELHIRQVNQGELSRYWFTEAKENDLLRFEGPFGTFCFRDKPQKNIIFLATGTGIAPIKSILEFLNQHSIKTENKNIYVYWGGRTIQDIYWQPDLTNLDIIFNPVLSKASCEWNGLTGYVQQAVIADKIDLADSTVYACGSDQMIHSAKALLISHGLNNKNFYSDAFVSST